MPSDLADDLPSAHAPGLEEGIVALQAIERQLVGQGLVLGEGNKAASALRLVTEIAGAVQATSVLELELVSHALDVEAGRALGHTVAVALDDAPTA